MSEVPDTPPVEAEQRRTARVTLILSETANGQFVAHPVAAPKWASYGPEEEVLAEQGLFFRELFARVPPFQISRLSLPGDEARIVRVEVLLPRDDIPRRRELTTPVEVTCVVVPANPDPSAQDRESRRGTNDVWVLAPRVGSIFYVSDNEPLEEAIRAEVRRAVAAQGLTPWELAACFPLEDDRLEVLDIPLDDPSRAPQKAGESLRKVIAERATRERAVRALSSVATPLHLAMRGFSPPPVIGRDQEQRSLRALLESEERQSVLLVGPEHAGKSALMSAFVAASARLVYATSGAQLIAGMSAAGEWQERIRAVLSAIHTLDAVLYFEDLEDLLSERTESGGVDFAGSIRPWVEDGKIRLVAEIRRDRLGALEGRYAGFFSSLRQVRIEPLSAALTRGALEARAAYDVAREPARPQLSPSALHQIVELAERYLPYGAFPGKAIRLYDDLRTSHDRARGQAGPAPRLEPGDVVRLFSFSTGVPEMLLSEDVALRVDDLAASLRKQIIGQELAISMLASTVGVVKAGLQPAGKPLATFLFVGPTGVGKTELSRALSELLFGGPDRLVRFDMTEMATADGAERLIRGARGAEGLLTQKIREQPFCVLLLDEIEKAHPRVFDLLLQVCGEGRLTDASGKIAYFHNTIVIMTSNLGAAERRATAGFGRADAFDATVFERAVHAAFRPEFVNRIDRIVPFRSLTQDEVHAVLRLGVDKLRRRRGLAERGVQLTVSEGALKRLGEEGYSVQYGARAMRRSLDEQLADPLARALANAAADEKEGTERSEVFADVTLAGEVPQKRDAVFMWRESAHGLDITISRRRNAKVSEQAVGERQIAALRREAEDWLDLAPIEALRDQLAFLVSELGNAGPKAKHKRAAQEETMLLAEHQRLNTLWTQVEDAHTSLCTAEEIAVIGLLEGHDVWPLLEDARKAHREIAQLLPSAFLALEPVRDRITWVLEELDPGAFDEIVTPFLRAAEQRSWTVVAHIDGDERRATDVWPQDRRWGPPRSPDDLRRALASDQRSFRGLVLRVKGQDAGVTLALETGLFRVDAPKRQEPKDKGDRAERDDGTLHAEIRAIGFFFDLPEEAWTHEALRPPQPASAAARRRGPAARELRYADGTVFLLGKRVKLDLDPRDYWASLRDVTLAHLVYLESEEADLDRSEWLALPANFPKETDESRASKTGRDARGASGRGS